MTKTKFAIAAFLVTLTAVGTSLAVVESLHPESPRFQAAWKDVFDQPEAMIRSVDAVVLARHVGTSPGRVAFSSDPGDAVPFELNHFTVERGMKGFRPDSALTIERIGGEQNGEVIRMDGDGGPFVAGDMYLLFINKQPESNYYYVVNDEARYAVGSDDRLESSSDGAVSSALRGKSVGEVASLIGRSLGGR